MALHQHRTIRDLQKYFLVMALVGLVFLLYTFVAAFLTTLFMAAVIVAAAYPGHAYLKKKFKLSHTWSAVLTLFLITVLVVVPTGFFFFAIAKQATSAYLVVNAYIMEFSKNGYDFFALLDGFPTLKKWIDTAIWYNPISTEKMLSTVGEMVGAISGFLLGQTTNILRNLSIFVLHAFIFLLSIFFLLRDGQKLVNYLHLIIPLPEKHEAVLFQKVYHLMQSLIYGIFGAALAQGFLAGLAFAILGVENALFWGAVAALFSPIPYVGTAIVWVPIAVSLFLSGQWVGGLFLTIWCLTLVGMADNFVKPYLIGRKSTLHPFLVMVVILGGAFAYGFKGLIFGPFILTLTLGLLHIYELEYEKMLGNNSKKSTLSAKKK